MLATMFVAILMADVKPKVQGFVHQQSDASGYVWPEDSMVLERLDRWQDLKFGVLFHFGLYSVPGIVESWSICSEDVDWITRKGNLPYDEYKEWYCSLKDSLNPVEFNPAQWADIMDKAGMKYMVFTTKHHDGFCNFPSRYTDYTIADGPFSRNVKSNVAKEVFEAFREKDFMIGCYFSKPDWHCPWYWNPEYSTPDRHENYKRQRHPDWWENYQGYTAGQLGELLGGDYGRFDILWLDGGWVTGDEIGLDSILVSARGGLHPGLISVDRSIRGKNENYQTPERGIPERQLPYPWESCIPLSNDWGWVPDAPFKSPERILALLAETTAKGGSLLLGVGPTAQGLIEPEVEWRLKEIGDWLKINGEAIYDTRTTPIYNEENVWFTASKDGNTLYAIYVPEEGSKMPKTIEWSGNVPSGKMTLLDGDRKLGYKVNGDKVTVGLPSGVKRGPVAIRFNLRKDENCRLPYKNPELSVDERVADLLSRMTLEEKTGQLLCMMGWEMYDKLPDGTIRISEKFRAQNSGRPVGSYWAVLRADPWTQKTLDNGLSPRESCRALNLLQQYAIDSTRLGIPIHFAEEAPHGHMAIGTTVMPTGLGMASTWNRGLLRKAGETVGREALLQGASIGYGPVIDIARDPRWSRMEETFGEDPCLTAELGGAYMEGMQDSTLTPGRRLISTLKHFAAYGSSEGGLNGGPVNVGDNRLFGELLPPFRRVVESGAGSLMTSYNTIDGIPSTANRRLLTDILRGRWGFKGFVVSDLFSIDGMIGSTASDRTEAAAAALRAGVDMDLGGNCFGAPLLEALERGLVTEEDIDRAVARVLRSKFEAGLFEHPYMDEKAADRMVGSRASRDVALEVAREGVVLLKNDGILPLRKDLKRIAVIGPNADMQYNQLGDYTAPQAEESVVTVLEGIKGIAGADTEVAYVKGCAVRDTVATDIDSAVEAAQASDAVVMVMGGSSARDFDTKYIATGAAESGKTEQLADMDCGEGFDRATLSLLGDQEKLLEAVLATGKPVIVVYIEGRPLDMRLPAEKAGALLCAWYPGGEGGRAIAEILFGDVNPSGRLPVSVPRSEGQLPVYYSQGERRGYMDLEASPLYPFGYGLGYTTFEYSDLNITQAGEEEFIVSCNVTNTGEVEGKETVQLYLSRKAGMPASRAIELKDFCKVSLQPGETREVTFRLDRRKLGDETPQRGFAVSPGGYKVMIGGWAGEFPLSDEFSIKN